MMKKFLIIGITFLFTACGGNKDGTSDFSDLKKELSDQLKVLVNEIPENEVPRSYPDEDGNIRFVGIRDWTCGFPGGSFWLMYELTGDENWKNAAVDNTEKLEGVQHRTNTHDLGFMVFCSYGNGYLLTGNENYKEIILQASESLITRFDSTVGCIRSWDFGDWEYPVIIDNMMNLELLFWATRETGDSSYYHIAVQHAETTMKNHFREDHSSYHVISYDTLSGEVVKRNTHQGHSHESAWARGQAWGLYGYTMTYRETGDARFLDQANAIAGFILSHPRLPDDGVPYWDYDAPDIPNTYRDVSAGAIAASALLELAGYVPEKQEAYDAAADQMLQSLATSYTFETDEALPFLLDHSVGHLPHDSEIDVPIIYADYYYLEALLRTRQK